MASNTIYTCTKCDAQASKWTGQCLECGAWGTVVEGDVPRTAGGKIRAGAASATARPAVLSALASAKSDAHDRLSTGIGELDRALGGGIIAGSVTLLGGEPGIGKSTISLALASNVARGGRGVVYVSGEESAGQIKMRADRLSLPMDGVRFCGEIDVDAVIATLHKEKPALAVIDSIQTLADAAIPSSGGSVAQVRTVTAKLVGLAKTTGTALVVVGHVTKDGTVAGPKTLEHLVDTVFSFEGERSHALRVLRVLKNRFGSSDETGMFEMTDAGLKEVKNPSAYLLDERQQDAPGSVITAILEGSRPLLVEVQALVQRTSFGYPARRATGIDQARLEMLLAVLARRGGVDLSQHDVYVNVVGGVRIKEPAADLAVALALVSAYADRPVAATVCAWGEVGLGGEVRNAVGSDRRLAEAAALGFTDVVTALPKRAKPKVPGGLKLTDVHDIRTLTRMMATNREKTKTAA